MAVAFVPHPRICRPAAGVLFFSRRIPRTLLEILSFGTKPPIELACFGNVHRYFFSDWFGVECPAWPRAPTACGSPFQIIIKSPFMINRAVFWGQQSHDYSEAHPHSPNLSVTPADASPPPLSFRSSVLATVRRFICFFPSYIFAAPAFSGFCFCQGKSPFP